MATQVVMPQMGESIAEGTITKWLKQVGDKVDRDEALLEISTDKVDTEIPSPAAGVLGQILVEEGQTVEVGTPLAIILAEGEKLEDADIAAAPAAAPAPAATPTPAPAAAPPPAPLPAAPPPPIAAPVATAAPAAPIPRVSNGRFYSPLVRSIAEAEGVSVQELMAIGGTGADGRVTKRDLLAYLERRPAAAGYAPVTGQVPTDQLVPVDRMRGLIAQHMVHSIHTSAHVFIMTDCDMTKIVEFRAKHKAVFEERTGEKLTYTPFFIKAAALALRDFPYVNAQLDLEAGHIHLKGQVNVGMAVAVPNPDGQTYGLIVPVIRNADLAPLKEIARQVNDLAARARVGQLQPEEPQGGTFTVTNMGVFGSYGGLPIINQPQVAILGLGAIEKRPAVVDDEIRIRHKMFMSVGIDHRLVDGALGGQFLERIRHYLENFEAWILA
jgi:pyruvate dehydrogenase complex dihydrolipoamide acetyltransferase long form